MRSSAPSEPTAGSGLDETKKYLEHLKASGQPIEIRRLIGFWGYRGRGKTANRTIGTDLTTMALRTEPPFDSGTLDAWVTIQKLSGDALEAAVSERPDDHLLTLARIPSASFALRVHENDEEVVGYVYRDALISDALTLMLREDYSQLPVVESKRRRVIVGVFNWESYSQARLRGEDPREVGEALLSATAVDLHSDLFLTVGPVADHGYVVVSYQGLLSGIVTASDLIRELEELALPFLAVGRCEQELRRVARGKLSPQLAKSNKPIEEFTFGTLQHFFAQNWNFLGWSLSQDEFIGWLDATRQLRNSIAHFDNQDADTSAELDAVNRLTRWLRSISTASEPTDIESDELTRLAAPKAKDVPA